MENDLTPVGRDELELIIAVQVAAMRARKEAGWLKDVPPFFAKALAARLLLANLKVFRGPPVAQHSATNGTKEPGW